MEAYVIKGRNLKYATLLVRNSPAKQGIMQSTIYAFDSNKMINPNIIYKIFDKVLNELLLLATDN